MKKVSVVVTRYNEPNELINPCLVALSNQKKINAIIYFLDQKKDSKTKELCDKLSNKNIKIIYKKIPIKSLSYARNVGIKLSKTEIVLFLDSDAIPFENWAFELSKIFDEKKNIGIVGGKSVPIWLKKQKWYHKSNLLMDIYSIFSAGEGIKETDRIVGVNFGLSKKVLGKESFFDENFGRKPGTLQGNEESDLCGRAIKNGCKVFYNGKSVVKHQIQKERMKLSWILRRAYYWGYDRGRMGGMPKSYTPNRNFYDKLFLLLIAPPYILGLIKGRIKENEKTKKKF